MKLKLTEDQTVQYLITYLENSGWHVGQNFCLGQKHGIDIKATKENDVLLVEVKGARAGDASPNKVRKHFDSGQIKTHFGKAIVKMLHEKSLNPNATLAIAHPDDEDIKRSISHMVPFLKDLGIVHYWVSADNITVQ